MLAIIGRWSVDTEVSFSLRWRLEEVATSASRSVRSARKSCFSLRWRLEEVATCSHLFAFMTEEEYEFQSPMEIGRGRDCPLPRLQPHHQDRFSLRWRLEEVATRLRVCRRADRRLRTASFSLRWRLEEVATGALLIPHSAFGQSFQSPMEIGRGRDYCGDYCPEHAALVSVSDGDWKRSRQRRNALVRCLRPQVSVSDGDWKRSRQYREQKARRVRQVHSFSLRWRLEEVATLMPVSEAIKMAEEVSVSDGDWKRSRP